MTRQWIGTDGWPADYPDGLLDALRMIPGADQLSEETIKGQANIVLGVLDGGIDAELPRNQLSSRSAGEAELFGFHDLCKKLADYVEAMREPSLSALETEGFSVFALLEKLREGSETARHALYGLNAPESKRGAPKKIAAASVAEIVAEYYEKATGRKPTLTKSSYDSSISGQWSVILEAVFKSLRMDASVEAQTRALSEKSRPK